MARVTINHREVGRMLRAEGPYHGIRTMLTEKMQPVLAAAKADPHDDTGDYERGLHIEQATTDRAVVRVVSGDWKGYILEARYGILARALDSAR